MDHNVPGSTCIDEDKEDSTVDSIKPRDVETGNLSRSRFTGSGHFKCYDSAPETTIPVRDDRQPSRSAGRAVDMPSQTVFGAHGMKVAQKEDEPSSVRKITSERKLVKRQSVRKFTNGKPYHPPPVDDDLRLKDSPGLYRIRAAEGVTASRTVRDSLGGSPSSKGISMVESLSLLSRSPLGNGGNERLFIAKHFDKDELVKIAEVDHTTVPGFVYGKVHVCNGWIPLIDTNSEICSANKVSIKEQVKMNLEKPVYDVKEFYKENGVWPDLARHPFFENVTLFVITINAFWMAVDADYNTSTSLVEAEPIFQIAEHFFCIYFSFEWFARFMAFERKRNGFKDGWFFFDSCLVGMMVVETWVMTVILVLSGTSMSGAGGNASMLRLLRLLRLSRLARMLRSMPELMIMIKGIVAALRTVGFTILLQVILMYIFAIMFRQLTNDTEIGDRFFRTILVSMYTLLLNATFVDDLYNVVNEIGAASYLYAGIFFVFILLSALTVMNMLIGVLCEVVSAVAKTEKENMLMEFVSAKMEEIMRELDADGDGLISKKEFGEIMQKPEAVRILQETGVDPMSLVDYVDFIFESEDGQDKELSLDTFMTVVLQFRSCNVATVKDAVDIRKWITKSFKRLDESAKKLTRWEESPEGKSRCSSKDGHASGHASARSHRSHHGHGHSAEVLSTLQRLDAFVTALAAELALLAADLGPCAVLRLRQPSLEVPCPGAYPSSSRPSSPQDEPPGGLPANSRPPSRRVGTAMAGVPSGGRGLPDGSTPLGFETQGFTAKELFSRAHRLEHFGKLAWDELQRLDGPGHSMGADAGSAHSLRLWRAMAEEFLLSAFPDGLERLRLPDGTGEVGHLQACVSGMLAAVRLRQSGLRSIVDAAHGGGDTIDAGHLSAALLKVKHTRASQRPITC
mmetsp:Transcript_65438/g.212938  ORF Transcript_65438/g.212938 Transcript_65438/m.212938 type:complete len:911 (+) Transcript_65438:146-2878(+)